MKPPLQSAKLGSGNYARENDLVRDYARNRVMNQYNMQRFYQQYLDPTYGAIAQVIGNARSNAAGRGFGRSGRMAQLTADQPLYSVRQQAIDAASNLGQEGLNTAYGYNRGMADSATNSMAWGVQNEYYGRPDPAIARQSRSRTRQQIG
jgi:hypothetical protein